MTRDADAVVIGGGPAGTATAILLARVGWRVILVEQDEFPRRKVCGECVAAGTLALLDDIGIGNGVRANAGPELRRIGWMSAGETLTSDFPICTQGVYRYGRTLRRDHLDGLLVDHAVSTGVRVIQPARVRTIGGKPGSFLCNVDVAAANISGDGSRCSQRLTLRTPIVVDAHGAWQNGPRRAFTDHGDNPRAPHRASDLFAFKAVYTGTALPPDLLSILAFPGGYGGMAVADQDRMTLACCIRRDTLARCRIGLPGLSAGAAVEAYLLKRCRGVREALHGAQRDGAWLTVGPVRPRRHAYVQYDPIFQVGNAAGQSHPLIGEGIGMALQAAAMLTDELVRRSPTRFNARSADEIQRCYAAAWRRAFSSRMRAAAIYSNVAMRPMLERPARTLIRCWPSLLTVAARLGGKARAATKENPGLTSDTRTPRGI
jgi:flavin-dependent dehydrogenase